MNRSPSWIFQTGSFDFSEVLSFQGKYIPTFLLEESPVTSMASQGVSDEKKKIDGLFMAVFKETKFYPFDLRI